MKTTHAIIAIAFAGGSVSAQTMDLVYEDRIIVGSGSFETIAGTTGFSSQQDIPFTPFQDWEGWVNDGAGPAGGSGQMTSMITNTIITASGSANANANFDSSEYTSLGALGSSAHLVAFTLAQSTTFTMDMSLEVVGTANAWARITELNGLDPDELIYEARTLDGLLEVNDTITLGPGDYSVQFFANSNITLTSDGSASGVGSYSGVFAIIPTPATTAPLFLASILTTRRRR